MGGAVLLLSALTTTATVVAGLDVHLSQESEVWGNVAGGARRGAVYTGVLTFGFDLDLETVLGLGGAKVGATGYFIQGGTISDEVGDIGVISNLAGVQTVRLFRAWYGQRFFEDIVELKVGLLAADDDFMVLERELLFMNSGFGTMQSLALNVAIPIYPLASPGAQVAVRPSDDWELLLGVYDGNAGDEEIDRYAGDLRLNSMQGATALAELSHRRKDGTKLSVGTLLHRDGEGGGPTVAYLMGEQHLLKIFDREVFGFAHLSTVMPIGRAIVQTYIDAGIVVEGSPWPWAQDRIGLGVAWMHFGREYRDEQLAAGTPVTASETVTELTYALEILQHFEVHLGLQWVLDAHFSRADALVLGSRLAVWL